MLQLIALVVLLLLLFAYSLIQWRSYRVARVGRGPPWDFDPAYTYIDGLEKEKNGPTTL